MKRWGYAVVVVLTSALLAGCAGDNASPKDAPSRTATPNTSQSPASDLPTVEQAQALASIDVGNIASAINMFSFNYGDRLPVVGFEDGYFRVNSETYALMVPGESLRVWGGDMTYCVEYGATVETQDGSSPITVHFDYAGAASAEAGPCPASATALGEIEFPIAVQSGVYGAYDIAPVKGTCFREEQQVLVGRADKQDAWVVVRCDEDFDRQIANGGSLTEEQFEAGLDEEFANLLCTVAWDRAFDEGFTEAWWVLPTDLDWAANNRDFFCLVAP